MSEASGEFDNNIPEPAAKQLLSIIESYERLEEERKAIAGDQKDKLAEAQALGFDVKAVRKILALRKKSREEREEEEAITAVYMHALGMIDETEMNAAAQPMAKRTTKRQAFNTRKAAEPERKAQNGYQADN